MKERVWNHITMEVNNVIESPERVELNYARQSKLVEEYMRLALSLIEFAISTGSFIRIDEDDFMSKEMEILTDTLPLVKESLEKAYSVLEMGTIDRGDTHSNPNTDERTIELIAAYERKLQRILNENKALRKVLLTMCDSAIGILGEAGVE
jgi:hypothetical protein